MAGWIDNMTDAQLAYEPGGFGQVITRTPSQIAAYRAQQAAEAERNMTLGQFLGQYGGPGGGGGESSGTAKFSSGLSDAEQRLKALLDNPESIQQTAGYKFRVGQGQEALERSLGARGLLRSGNRLQELTKYGQDMASQEYDNQANRLGSLLGNYGQLYNQSRGIDETSKANMANVWARAGNSGSSGGSAPISRSTSSFTFQNPSVFSQPAVDLWSDPTIQRLRQSRDDAYNY